MSDLPMTESELPSPEGAPVAVEAVEAPAPRTFVPPKGFETKFQGLALHLSAFDGPLDLLLHLIREQKLDILDLPMATVTRQYMDYLHLMEELNLEIAAEFVAMAAHLLQIKSRLMLPRQPAVEEGVEDPREELVQRLLDYQAVKQAASQLHDRESLWRQVTWTQGLEISEHARVEDQPLKATLFDLLACYRDALTRLLPPPPVEVRTPPKTLDQRVLEVMGNLIDGEWHPFGGLLHGIQTREEIVLTFLALLELVRTGRVNLVQPEPFGEIHIQTKVA